MRNKIITFLLVFSSSVVLAQNLEIDIHGRKLGYFIMIENKLKSEVFTSRHPFSSDPDLPPPVIYRRKEKNIPDLLVYYFYNGADSTINRIIYVWDTNNFPTDNLTDKKIAPKSRAALVERYRRICRQVELKYGASKSSGNVKDLSKVNLTSASRSDDWLPTDYTRITAYLHLSDEDEKHGSITIPAANNVRLFVYDFTP